MNNLSTFYTYAKLAQAAYIDLSPFQLSGTSPYKPTDMDIWGQSKNSIKKHMAITSNKEVSNIIWQDYKESVL